MAINPSKATNANVPSPSEAERLMQRLLNESTFMNLINICIVVLIPLLAILAFYRMRKLPQMAGYGAQRMCPACGLITSRLKACCLECGKPLSGVTSILGK
jgi:hypothetical protein